MLLGQLPDPFEDEFSVMFKVFLEVEVLLVLVHLGVHAFRHCDNVSEETQLEVYLSTPFVEATELQFHVLSFLGGVVLAVVDFPLEDQDGLRLRHIVAPKIIHLKNSSKDKAQRGFPLTVFL